jgi:hypothetical protein
MYKKTHLKYAEMLHSLSMIAGVIGAFVFFGKWLGYPTAGMFGDGSVFVLLAVWLELVAMYEVKRDK